MIVKTETEKQLAAEVIKRMKSEWASSIVLVPTKDGMLRFRADHRKLNTLTRLDERPLFRMEDCIDSFDEATVFSTVDCNSDY